MYDDYSSMEDKDEDDSENNFWEWVAYLISVITAIGAFLVVLTILILGGVLIGWMMFGV